MFKKTKNGIDCQTRSSRNDEHPHSRGTKCPSLAKASPSSNGGRRECRCDGRTRSLVQKAHEVVTTGTPKAPAFPARWCYGLYALSSVNRAFLPPSPRAACRTNGRHRHAAKLDPSVGRSGPHDFAVRNAHPSSDDAVAAIASRPTFRDDWP
jgi:hypothetical protein